MSGSPISAPACARSESSAETSTAATTAEIDASCRGPVLLMFGSAVLWIVFASLCGLLASIKLHSGAFLSQCPTVTYGRLYPAFTNAFLYGFAIQAGLATTLWLLCRLGRSKLQGAGTVFVAAMFWNLGVTIGVVGILAGFNTGFEWLEISRHAALLLFISYSLIAVKALLTFHARSERELYPAQWYLVVALFIFPWAFSAATYLLLCQPVRGVVQLAVHTWYASNVQYLFLVPVGTATLYYFIPKVLQRPLNSPSLAKFALGILLVSGGWIGLTVSSPLPAWLVSLSLVAGTFVLVAILAIASNLHQTITGAYRQIEAAGAIRFFGFSAFSLLIAGLVTAVISLPSINRSVQFTHFMTALRLLWLYAFFAMGAFGAIYHIVPKLVGVEWPSRKLIAGQFWLAVLGTVPTIGVVAAGGFIQGHEMAKLGVPFADVIRLSLPALRFSTLGELLLLASHGLLLVNMFLLCRQVCGNCCRTLCGSCGVTAKTGGSR